MNKKIVCFGDSNTWGFTPVTGERYEKGVRWTSLLAEYTGYEVLVQGVMDCVLQNGNRITVIDYKTDYVENMGQLKERYEKQLELYRHGAKALFNTDNVKCLLYSFRLGQFIEF